MNCRKPAGLRLSLLNKRDVCDIKSYSIMCYNFVFSQRFFELTVNLWRALSAAVAGRAVGLSDKSKKRRVL